MDGSSEDTIVNFGKSIIVPSVQELAKNSLTKLPPRYATINPDDDPVVTLDDNTVVPVIDLEKLVAGDSMDSELERLHLACKDWGFFQVMNHGVNAAFLEDFKLEIESFFKLPYEEKKKLWQKPDDGEGFGQLFVVSDEQKLDWADIFYLTTLPLCLRRNYLFSQLPPRLRESLETYSREMKRLAISILDEIGKALKIDSKELKELFSEGVQLMRFNYYPQCPEPSNAIGLSPHSDGYALTILFQLGDTQGLQIRKNGCWIPINPLPTALLVNVGDIMEIISNGAYRSIEHRATVNSTKERISVATFYGCKLESMLGPAQSIISPKNPPIFGQISMEQFTKEFFARKLSGKSTFESFRIENGE